MRNHHGIAVCTDCGGWCSSSAHVCKECRIKQLSTGGDRHYCIDCGRHCEKLAKRCWPCWLKYSSKASDERFWCGVKRGEPDECWPWTRSLSPKGYGRVRGRNAHRVAYELTYGPIPPGMFVCHTCDNPPCCNPAHLFLGTYLDNIADMVAKKRSRGRFSQSRVIPAECHAASVCGLPSEAGPRTSNHGNPAQCAVIAW